MTQWLQFPNTETAVSCNLLSFEKTVIHIIKNTLFFLLPQSSSHQVPQPECGTSPWRCRGIKDHVPALLANKAQRTVHISCKVQTCSPPWHWWLVTKICLQVNIKHFFLIKQSSLRCCILFLWQKYTLSLYYMIIITTVFISTAVTRCYQCKDSIMFALYFPPPHFLRGWHLDRWVSWLQSVDILPLMSSCGR